MPSAQLAPWTLAWFGAAMLCLLAALGLGLGGAVAPGDWARGGGLAAVHLFALGWLGLMMLGALVQFVPVLTAQPLARPGLALPALLLAVAGTLALASGFGVLEGQTGAQDLFLLAPVLLGLAIALVLAMILPPLWARTSLRLAEVRMVLLALLALAGLWASGSAMVLELSGLASLGFLPEGLPLHILFGLGGFLSLAAFGVSYKLFAMFLLAPDQGGRLRQVILLLAGLALAGLGAEAVGLALPPLALWALVLPLAAGLYLAEVARLWRRRRRPQAEGNMRWSRGALAYLALAASLALPALSQGGPWAEAAIFATLTGWLSLLTLAQMIKIISFLTWIQVFAPRIGRAPVPLVQDLSDPAATARGLALWAFGAGLGTVSLLLAWPPGLRLALLVLGLAALALLAEAVAIRRLSHLPAALRPAVLPPLILPAPPCDTEIRHDHTDNRPA